MSTTTTRTAQINVPIDLDVPALTLARLVDAAPVARRDDLMGDEHWAQGRPTLDDLMADERVLVDVWDTEDHDGEPVVALIGEEAAVQMSGDVVTLLDDLHNARPHMGMEGPVPIGVEVLRHDERTPVEADPVAPVFGQRAERVASWTLIREVIR